MRLRELLVPTSGFQRSVSVLYDLDDQERVRGFIPTDHAEWVLCDVLNSLAGCGTRASMLIGSYGTGKSHLVTFLGSLLGKRIPSTEFELATAKIRDRDLRAAVVREVQETRPYLIVPVMGGTHDVRTSLLKGLKRALERERIRIPIESAFSKAKEVIGRWREEYAETYSRFEAEVQATVFQSADKFLQALDNADKSALTWFDGLHRKLSAGAEFDPYGSDIVEIYVSVARELPKLGYRGVFIIFDEFNKVLEEASHDTLTLKALQDLAETCNRSDENMSLYLMLISHKTIGQYVTGFVKERSEEWLKVEGRFRLYDLTRHPGERYQLMSRVLTKSREDWREVLRAAGIRLLGADRAELRELFGIRLPNSSVEAIDDLVKECFPLHPVLVYCLPLVSNRLAQNERTMFTFMASPDESPISRLLELEVAEVDYIYPYQLFDYFESEMRRASEADIRTTWMKVANALQQFNRDQVESKILRTVGILSILGNQLLTTKEMVQFSLYPRVSGDDFDRALVKLIEKKLVFWGDTGTLAISVPVGVDINAELAARMNKMTLEPEFDLQKYGIKDYVVPRRFNHKYGMIRYLSPMYVDYRGLVRVLQETSNGLNSGVDGLIVYVFPNTLQELAECRRFVLETCPNQQVLIVLPTQPVPVREAVLKLRALDDIRNSARKVRTDEELENVLDMYFYDALSHLQSIVSQVTAPSPSVEYYWKGKKHATIRSFGQLSDLASSMMESVYEYTPVVNNELVNRVNPTSISRRALNLVIDEVLRGKAKIGTKMRSSQEQFMFDTLFVLTGLHPDEDKPRSESFTRILQEVESYLNQAKGKPIGLGRLISTLTQPPYGIRLGIIPVFLASVLSRQTKTVVFRDRSGAECLLNSSLLEKITNDPEAYSVEVESWNDCFDSLVLELGAIFGVDLGVTSPSAKEFEILGDAVFRWFVSLPKYARETKRVDEVTQNFRRAARRIIRNPREVILHDIPDIAGCSVTSREGVQAVLGCVRRAKVELESALNVERGVVRRITEDMLRGFGVGQGSVLEMAREFVKTHADKLGVSLDLARFADCVQNHARTDNDFIESIAEELTGIRLEDWTDETESSFRATLEEIFDTTRHVEDPPSGPQVEITIPAWEGESARRYFIPGGPVSETAILLQSELESSIDDFGDSVSRTEVKQVLLNILKRMLAS